VSRSGLWVLRAVRRPSILSSRLKRTFIYGTDRSFSRSCAGVLVDERHCTAEPQKKAHPLAAVFTAASVAEIVVEEDGGSTFFADMVTGPIISGLETIHAVSGLPWWASIVVSKSSSLCHMRLSCEIVCRSLH
jgi:hypothetical protein